MSDTGISGFVILPSETCGAEKVSATSETQPSRRRCRLPGVHEDGRCWSHTEHRGITAPEPPGWEVENGARYLALQWAAAKPTERVVMEWVANAVASLAAPAPDDEMVAAFATDTESLTGTTPM